MKQIHSIKYNARVQASMRMGEQTGDRLACDYAVVGEYHATHGKMVKEIHESGMYFPVFDIDFENGDVIRVFNPCEVLFKEVKP